MYRENGGAGFAVRRICDTFKYSAYREEYGRSPDCRNRRFENHKQVNAFAGIDIRRYQSGKFLAKDHINKRGNKHLRKLLYIVVMNMLKQQHVSQNHLVDYYQKLKNNFITSVIRLLWWRV